MLLTLQDKADGEFGVVKSKIDLHMQIADDADFTELITPEAFVSFGNSHLATPTDRAKEISKRIFMELDPAEIRKRQRKVCIVFSSQYSVL